MSWTHFLAFVIGYAACLLVQGLIDAFTSPEVSNRIHDDEGHK